MKLLLLLFIRLYQQLFSSRGLAGVVWNKKGSCRFFPNCSTYTHDAIKKHGIIQGLYLGGKRVLRCHPFNPGGIDLVP